MAARSPSPKQLLARVRKIVGAWPETRETISHGAETFWGGRKTFASMAIDVHGDGRKALWIKSDRSTQADLVESDPGAFFVPPYVGPSGWIGVHLDRGLDWGVVEGLLFDGYRSVAPKRALKLLGMD